MSQVSSPGLVFKYNIRTGLTVSRVSSPGLVFSIISGQV